MDLKSKDIAPKVSKRNLSSICFVLLGALSLSLCMASIKKVDKNISTFLILNVRCFFGFLLVLPFAYKNFVEIKHTKYLKIHVYRVIVVSTAMFFTYYTYRNLPISMATSIGMSGPLFTTLLTIIVFRERVNLIRWVLLLIGYAGVVIVIKPTSFELEIGIVTSILANVLASINILIIRKLSQSEPPIVNVFFLNLGLLLVTTIISPYNYNSIPSQDLVFIGVAGFFGVSIHFFHSYALKFSSPILIAPFEYTRIVYSAVIGIYAFKELLENNLIIGSCIIIAINYILLVLDKKKAKQP